MYWLIKIKHLVLGLGFSLLLSGCNSEKTVKEENEIRAESEILALETLLKEKNYEDLLVKLETLDLPESETDKVDEFSTKFVDQLISENNYTFISSKYYRIRSAVSRDNWIKMEKFSKQGKELVLNEMEQAVRNKDFQKVQEMFDNEKGLHDNEEFLAMYNYALYLQTDQNSYKASGALALAVDPKYYGRMKDEIIAGVTNTSYKSPLSFGPITETDWNYIESEYQRNLNTMIIRKEEARVRDEKIEAARGMNPTLGMTYDEVKASLWGEPIDINRTVTVYGSYEQWVYGNGQYLYFEDGILTSFQD